APRHPPCALSSLTIKPLPTNGLQVEGQGSVQEPWFRSADRPTSRRQIVATKTLLIDSRLRLRSFSNDRVNNSLFDFQSPRDIAARGGNYSDFPTRVNLPRPPFAQLAHRWRKWDSNPRPSACKADALPAELFPQVLSGSPADTRWARQDLNLRP